MSSSRFSWPSAVLLSLCTLSDAWVLHRKAESKKVEADNVARVELRRHDAQKVNADKRQTTSLFCPDDRFQMLLDSNPAARIQTFCNEWLGVPAATTTIEYIPTITVTTSAESTTTTTSTTRAVTTETFTQTATTTLAPVMARAANIAAAAEDIIASVVESGTTANDVASPTKNSQRLQAEQGLSTACSCKLVDPTSTVTESYALPPVYTTVGYRILVLAVSTETRRITAFTTVTETLARASSLPVASAGNVSNASSSVASIQTSALPIAITPTSVEVLPSGGSSNTSSLAAATVTGLPFTCPDAANTQVDQVVGNFKLDYLIYCNTEITSEDRIGAPIDTDSEATCAAQCSALNAQSGQGTCQAAAFTPYTDGRLGGSCVISGNNTQYATKPGAVAIVNTGMASNGNQCAALEAANSTRSFDTSALMASITSGGVALSNPGLITQTADGGVSETYVSANSTDAGGTVHWSWYRVSASSSYWWAVYGTSYSCTRTITQTVVQQPPTALPVTHLTEIITTIINGATTTYISGSSTRVVVGGGGEFGPGSTFVPASTTSGSGEVTTFFSTATLISTGDSGVIPPTAGATPTPSLPAASGSVSSVQGSIEIIVSGSTSTYTSTGGGGLLPPSPSPAAPVLNTTTTTTVTLGTAEITVSGSTLTASSAGGGGLIPPPSVNVTEIVYTSAGTTYTVTSTGASGAVPPVPASSFPGLIETISVGSTVLIVSFSTATTISEGGNGIIPPVPTSTGPFTFTETVTVGGGNITIGGSTQTAGSTGGEGLIPPPLSTPALNVTVFTSSGIEIISIGASTAITTSTGASGAIPPPSSVLPNVTVSSGVEIFSTSGSTAVLTSTGSFGEIPPPSSIPSSPPNITVSSGFVIFSTSGSTATISSIGASGIIPPGSANVTISGPTNPVPTPIVVISTTGGVGNITISGGTFTSSATGDNGIITPSTSAPSSVPTSPISIGSTGTNDNSGPRTPSSLTDSTPPASASASIVQSSNSSTTVPPSVTPSASLNVTTSLISIGSTGTNDNSGPRTPSSLTDSTPPASASASIVQSSNSSTTVPPSVTPSASLNITSSLGSIGTNSDEPRSPFPLTDSTPPASASASIVPSSNSSLTVTVTFPPSVTPSASLNTTSSLGSIGTNSDQPRSPFPLTDSTPPASISASIVPSSNSSLTVTVTFPPSVTPSASLNTTSSLGSTGTNSDQPRSPFPLTDSTPPASISASIVQSSNATFTVTVTIPPSVTPSASLNITSSLGSTGTNSDQPRSPFPLTSSSVSGLIVPPSNSSITVPPSVTPSASVNITTSLGSIGTNSDQPRSPFPLTSSTVSEAIVIPSNSTVVVLPSVTPSASLNITVTIPIPPSVTPNASLNITVTIPIPPSATPSGSSNITVTIPPSATPSASLNITSSLGSTGTNSDQPRSPFPLTSSGVSTSIPPASVNSTTPASSTPGTGTFTQTTPLANISIPATTGAPPPSVSIPGPSSNVTSSIPVTETVVIPPTGGNFTLSTGTGTTVLSVTIPSASANITIPVTLPVINITSVPSATPSASANITIPVTLPVINITSVPSATPSASLNITYTPPIALSNSSYILSASPTPSCDSCTPLICPTVAVTVTETIAASVQVVTTTVVQTVTASAAIVVSAAPDASSAPAIFRARGTPATPAQRDAACNVTTNIIRNANFSQSTNDGSVADWDIDDNNDPNITLDSVTAGTGNSSIAQFRSAAAGRELTVTQAMTLCPGQEYEFAASTEQADALADCHCSFNVVYADGTKVNILTVEPTENWERQNATFTAGAQPEADLQISARCDGYKGLVVTDQTGWMSVEVQGVSMVKDDD